MYTTYALLGQRLKDAHLLRCAPSFGTLLRGFPGSVGNNAEFFGDVVKHCVVGDQVQTLHMKTIKCCIQSRNGHVRGCGTDSSEELPLIVHLPHQERVPVTRHLALRNHAIQRTGYARIDRLAQLVEVTLLGCLELRLASGSSTSLPCTRAWLLCALLLGRLLHAFLLRRSSLLPRTGRNRPRWQIRNLLWKALLIDRHPEIHSSFLDVVEVLPEPELRSRALQGLRFSSGTGVGVVGV